MRPDLIVVDVELVDLSEREPRYGTGPIPFTRRRKTESSHCSRVQTTFLDGTVGTAFSQREHQEGRNPGGNIGVDGCS